MPHDPLGWLRIADALALALVGLRLSFGGLFRAFPALFIHAIVESVVVIVSLVVPFSQSGYGLYFISTTPLRWILWVAIVFSLYRQTLALHKGLAALGRRVFIGALVATGLFIAFTLPLEVAKVTSGSWILTAVLSSERAITTALALLVLSLCAFLAFFLIPTRRNTAYLCMGFGIVFAGRSAACLVRNVGEPEIYNALNLVSIALSAVIFFAFAAVLSPAGEQQTAFVARHPSPREVEAAVGRLGKLTRHLRG